MFSYLTKSLGQTLYNLDIKSRRKSANAECKVITTSDLTYHYLEAGDREGETVVLLHGFSDHKDNIFRVARALLKNYRLILPDLPGFGNTDKPQDHTYNLQQYAKWITQFFDAMQIEKCHLFGHSLGGAISATIAVDYPEYVKSLALLNSGGIVDLPPTGIYKQLSEGRNIFAINNPEEFDEFLHMNLEKIPFLPKSVRYYLYCRYIENRDWYTKLMDDLMGHVTLDEIPPEALNDKVTQITQPTVVIWSEKDKFFSLDIAQKFIDAIPNSKLVTIPDVGHCVNLENPRAVGKSYLSFLQELCLVEA